MLEDLPVIKRQDVVTVVYETQTLRISTKAIAREDGLIGSRIRVRNADSQKEFEATVIRSGVVAVNTMQEETI
jgi:flagella basal body P-ring formation protein FlgA